MSDLPPALAQRGCIEAEEEEGALDEVYFDCSSSSSHCQPAPALATFMEKEEYFDAEEYPVSQVGLPAYDPNNSLWMYIEAW